MNSSEIEKHLHVFLTELINRLEIDLIVCSERKGTVVLRLLIQECSEPFKWPWDKVISTSAIDSYKWDSFSGKNILLFEELVHHGNTLRKHKERLLKHVPDGRRIFTAGFAVWYECIYQPDFAYFQSIDDEAYEDLRDDIIAMLQKYGSLLLDTEHIELTVRLHCGLNEFYDELARDSNDGNTFSFLSGANRTNLTINDPDIYEEDIQKLLTPGSNIKGSVRKCRILEKTHDQFALIPVFYPNTRYKITDEWIENLPSFIDHTHMKEATPTEIFYFVGLLASIEIIKGVVSALSDLIREHKIILETPLKNFQHLKVMYPRVDLDGLWEYVKGIVDKSKKEMMPKRGRQAVRHRNLSYKELLNMSYQVLTWLSNEYENYDKLSSLPKGRSWSQIIERAEKCSKRLNVGREAVSIITDRLIDGGLIVTEASEVTNLKGETWVVRTFTPDSEIVLKKTLRQLSVKGENCLIMT